MMVMPGGRGRRAPSNARNGEGETEVLRKPGNNGCDTRKSSRSLTREKRRFGERVDAAALDRWKRIRYLDTDRDRRSYTERPIVL